MSPGRPPSTTPPSSGSSNGAARFRTRQPPPPTPTRPYHGVGGGGWERQTPDHIYIYIYIYIHTDIFIYIYIYIFIFLLALTSDLDTARSLKPASARRSARRIARWRQQKATTAKKYTVTARWPSSWDRQHAQAMHSRTFINGSRVSPRAIALRVQERHNRRPDT